MSAQGPLVLELGLKGLGLRVWGQGLTILAILNKLILYSQACIEFNNLINLGGIFYQIDHLW